VFGSFTNPIPHRWRADEQHCALDAVCRLTNEVALDFNGGDPASCVLTSHALAYVLQALGHDAYPLRVQARAYPAAMKSVMVVLGGLSDGYRRKASPGMWGGHLAVVAGGYLLDPTFDQVNTNRTRNRWPAAVRYTPMVIPIDQSFLDGDRTICVRFPKGQADWMAYPRQCGFARAGDARPSHWKPLAEAVLGIIEEIAAAGKVAA
jgi:hypothetical protein